MSYCPACGHSVSGTGARFCMKCGRELPAAPPATPPPPAAPPTPTYGTPVPPAYAPTGTYPGAGPGYPAAPPPPVAPSPAALFARRVFAGPWKGAVPAALVPAAVLLVAAGGLGAWSQHAFRGPAVSWFVRSRIALALAVQGLGGHLSIHPSDGGAFGDDVDCSDYSDGSDYYDGSDYGDGARYGDACSHVSASASISVVPLTFTLLWLLALVLVLRSARRRQAGPEAAVRVALLSAAAATVLSFVAQPSLQGASLHSGPFRVLLWSFLLSLATALLVLNGPAVRTRFAAVQRVVSTALIALLATVALASVVVFCVAVGNYDNVTGDGLVLVGAVLPNLGLSGLALGWGAPFKVHEGLADTQADYHYSFGLSQLSHFWDGWSTVLAVIGGALCALIIGLLATVRTRDRAEQFAVAGVFTVMFTVLVAIGGLKTGGASQLDGIGGGLASSRDTIGSAVPETLLFALLWSCGGVLAAPYLRRVLGGSQPPPVYSAAGPAQAGPPSPYAPPPFPYVPPQAPQPQQVHDLGIVQPERLSDDGSRRDGRGGEHR
ncbi:zinc ribbon domain-containing protein [Streptomyces sp. IBSBF 2435]|uniref:zinc ribbon domain-containing protein n=1 Tax=Streptomyces sp. IBSBF 2435 TaxID=2903531 RepID=UPI002FDBE264